MRDNIAAIRNIISMSGLSGHCVSEEAAQDLLKQVDQHLVEVEDFVLSSLNEVLAPEDYRQTS